MKPSRSQSHVPGLTNTAIAIVAFMLVSIFALRAAPSQPPAIAEFAPEAQQQIKNAPSEQTGLVGIGEGGGLVASVLPSPSPSPSPGGPGVDPGKVKLCVGNRQIEDPQSPPCVPYFFGGDNGGATSPGVTGSSITVLVSLSPSDSGNTRGGGTGGRTSTIADLQAFFNKRFEFYGRQLKLIPYSASSPPPASGVSPSLMQSDADNLYAQYHPFADLAYASDQNGQSYIFYDQLARHKIISIEQDNYELPAVSEAHMTANAPYEWNYLPVLDDIERNLSEMVCRSLSGKPPTAAGAPENGDPKRVFGILHQTYTNGVPAPDIQPLLDGMATCGEHPMVKDFYTGEPQESPMETNAMLAMSTATPRVTSIICICHPGSMDSGFMPAAQSENYFPEWITQNFIDQEDDYAGQVMTRSEVAHAIGMRSHNKAVSIDKMPWDWAVAEVDPANAPANGPIENWNDTYYNLLVLASGIQMAGPHLTPETFQAALLRTQFPNPGAGAAPYYQARVGFDGGSHTMVRDFAPTWFSINNVAPDNGNAGTYCYINGGVRYGLGEWPVTTFPFQGPGPCF